MSVIDPSGEDDDTIEITAFTQVYSSIEQSICRFEFLVPLQGDSSLKLDRIRAETSIVGLLMARRCYRCMPFSESNVAEYLFLTL